MKRLLLLLAALWQPAFAQVDGSKETTPPTSQQRLSGAEGFRSEWTVDTLHALINARLNEIFKQYDTKFLSLEKAMQLATETQDARVRDAFAAADKAVSRTDDSIQKQLASTVIERQEIRESLMKLEELVRLGIPRADSERRAQITEEKIESLSTRIDIKEGQAGGQSQLWGLIGGGILLFIAVIMFVFAIAARIPVRAPVEPQRNGHRVSDAK